MPILAHTDGGWLGFVIDTPEEKFRVSKTKLAKVKEVLLELTVTHTITHRLLAKAAGRIIAMGPAVLPASLFRRPLFQAIQGRVSWDELFPTPQTARGAAQLFLDCLQDWNGRRWFPCQVLLEAASDAFHFGFGGTLQVAGQAPFELVGTMTEVEASQSNTARKMLGFLRILQQAVLQHRDIISGAAVLLVGDNQGAVAAVNNFRSSAPDVHALLKEIFELCSDFDFDVLAQ
jgi:hypothetical protein